MVPRNSMRRSRGLWPQCCDRTGECSDQPAPVLITSGHFRARVCGARGPGNGLSRCVLAGREPDHRLHQPRRHREVLSSPDRARGACRNQARQSVRERDLPAHAAVYHGIALALSMRSSTREVLRCLLKGGAMAAGPAGPGKSGRHVRHLTGPQPPACRAAAPAAGPTADVQNKGSRSSRDARFTTRSGHGAG